MAEINNSLALGVRSDPIDITKPLLAAGQIRALNTKSDLEQQQLEHNKFLYDQGGGYSPTELNTNATRYGEVLGRAGNILANDQSKSARETALKLLDEAHVPMSPLVRAHLMTASPELVRQYGINGQRYGQSSSENVEQSGVPAGARAREAGKYEPYPIPANAPIVSRTAAATATEPSQARVDNAVKTGRNFDGSPRVTSAADVVGNDGGLPAALSPHVVRNPDGSISSSVTPETEATQRSLGEDYAGYKESAKNAAMTKYLLRNMQDDADRISTGKGATFTNTVKQWVQSAQSLPAVGDTIKKITGDISDPIAAFEALAKNAGQLTRATLKDVDGKAASEYQMIQRQLPNAEMSPRGLKLVAAQMMAPEDFKQAKLQAADHWKSANRGSLAGFESDWNSHISPTTFLLARLPPQDRDVLIKNLNKTEEGRNQLGKIRAQTEWAHAHHLDGFID